VSKRLVVGVLFLFTNHTHCFPQKTFPLFPKIARALAQTLKVRPTVSNPTLAKLARKQRTRRKLEIIEESLRPCKMPLVMRLHAQRCAQHYARPTEWSAQITQLPQSDNTHPFFRFLRGTSSAIETAREPESENSAIAIVEQSVTEFARSLSLDVKPSSEK